MKRAPKRDGWLVRDVRGSYERGFTYTTNVVGKGGRPVTVKLTTKGTHICLTCNTADTCEHSKFVSDYITANGLPA